LPLHERRRIRRSIQASELAGRTANILSMPPNNSIPFIARGRSGSLHRLLALTRILRGRSTVRGKCAQF
jgi:hypothetical protein